MQHSVFLSNAALEEEFQTNRHLVRKRTQRADAIGPYFNQRLASPGIQTRQSSSCQRKHYRSLKFRDILRTNAIHSGINKVNKGGRSGCNVVYDRIFFICTGQKMSSSEYNITHHQYRYRLAFIDLKIVSNNCNFYHNFPSSFFLPKFGSLFFDITYGKVYEKLVILNDQLPGNKYHDKAGGDRCQGLEVHVW